MTTTRAIRLPRLPKSLTVNALALPHLGLIAVGWAYLGTQAALAAAVTPFTVRLIPRAEFAGAPK
jgi:hypothetical protein